MNETIVAKEEQQIKADILTLEKMSTFEQSVRNLSAEVSNNMADNSRLTDAIQNTISSLKSSVKWLLDFVEDLSTGDSKNADMLKTGNATVRT
jgi:hypothetical protein